MHLQRKNYILEMMIFLWILLIVPITYVTANITDGLVAYYPFNGNANDVSGHNYNGTVYGAALALDRFGISNKAYFFDGVNDYIGVITNPFNFPTGNSSRTISAWIKSLGETEGHKYQTVVGWGYGYIDSGLFALERGGDKGSDYDDKLFAFGRNNDFAGGSNINFNLWYHVAVTYDGNRSTNNLTIYLNGNNDGTTSKSYNTQTYNWSFKIGNAPPNDGWHKFFNGYIDDVRIYDRALSASEIHTLYAAPEPVSSALFLLGAAVLGIKQYKKRK